MNGGYNFWISDGCYSYASTINGNGCDFVIIMERSVTFRTYYSKDFLVSNVNKLTFLLFEGIALFI
jgi:hypothetical protein